MIFSFIYGHWRFSIEDQMFSLCSDPTPFCLTATQLSVACSCREPIGIQQARFLLLSGVVGLEYLLSCKLHLSRVLFSELKLENLSPPLPPLGNNIFFSVWLMLSNVDLCNNWIKVLICETHCRYSVDWHWMGIGPNFLYPLGFSGLKDFNLF